MNRKNRQFPRVVAGTLLSVAATGCGIFDTVYGSGRAAEEERSVDPFDHMVVRAGLHAEVSEGPQAVTVRGDDNIVPEVLTTVSDGRLIIEPGADFHPVVPLVITVSAPYLNAARLEAGGRLHVFNIAADNFWLSLDAGGNVSASGTANHLNVALTAGGTIDADHFSSSRVSVRGEAGGTMSVNATDAVDGSVESGSIARVHGGPAARRVSTASGGKVVYVE